jgi:DNA primase
MIPAETVEQIYQTAVIEDVIGDYVELKKQGSSYRGLSPFTSEKTPSFYVVPSKGIFKCFSSGKGGSLLTFLMEHEKVSYPEALRILARRYNIEIVEKERTAEEIEAETVRESLGGITAWAQKWFTDQLHTETGKAIGLSYFKSRGFDEATLEKFKVGYCPEGWDLFTKAAVEAGYAEERLEQTGLCKRKNDGEGLFDFFHGRIMFPIRDVTGRVIGFGGRTLKTEKKIAKYFNSPESPLYDKSRTLYGIHLAKPHISKEDMCLIVEGYTDVMAMHQSGVENVVASSGTALTPGQIALIRRFTKYVTVLFDGDAAGMRASLRGIDLLLEEGMKVKVVTFPDGDDPDSYSKKVSSTELQKFVKEDAQDFLAFKADLLSTEAGDDPIKRAEMVQSLVDTIACIPDPIQQSVYVQTVAARLNLQEGLLVSEVAKKVARKAQKPQRQGGRTVQAPPYEPPSLPIVPNYTVEPPRANRTERRILEDNLVKLLLEHGENMVTVEVEAEDGEGTAKLDVTFAELLLHRVHEFGLTLEDESSKFIVSEYEESIGKGELPSTEDFFSGTSEDVQQKAANMLVNRYSLSENWEHKHHIFTTKEEDVLEQTLSASTNRILLHDTLKTIDAVLKAMEQSGISAEEVNRLLKEKMELDKKVGKLSSDLNIIILPK